MERHAVRRFQTHFLDAFFLRRNRDETRQIPIPGPKQKALLNGLEDQAAAARKKRERVCRSEIDS
jgi:hypothetical protein